MIFFVKNKYAKNMKIRGFMYSGCCFSKKTGGFMKNNNKNE